VASPVIVDERARDPQTVFVLCRRERDLWSGLMISPSRLVESAEIFDRGLCECAGAGNEGVI